jgi:hypothetical protein
VSKDPFELDSLLVHEEEKEDITAITMRALVHEPGNYALFKYVRHKHGHLDRRLTRLERLAFACVVIVMFAVAVLEVWRSLKHP